MFGTLGRLCNLLFRRQKGDEMVRCVLSTDLFLRPAQEFAETCQKYDPTFLPRYSEHLPTWLAGERFYDGDKYSIFYLTMPRKDIMAFVRDVTSNPATLFVGEIDENYDLKKSQKPFFQSPKCIGWNGKFWPYYITKRDTRYPLKLAEVPEDGASSPQLAQ